MLYTFLSYTSCAVSSSRIYLLPIPFRCVCNYVGMHIYRLYCYLLPIPFRCVCKYAGTHIYRSCYFDLDLMSSQLEQRGDADGREQRRRMLASMYVCIYCMLFLSIDRLCYLYLYLMSGQLEQRGDADGREQRRNVCSM